MDFNDFLMPSWLLYGRREDGAEEPASCLGKLPVCLYRVLLWPEDDRNNFVALGQTRDRLVPGRAVHREQFASEVLLHMRRVSAFLL